MSSFQESRDAASNQLQNYAQQSRNADTLTTSNGAPVDSLTASMTVGPGGPIVLQDFSLLDHMAKFDRERIPERVVHAKGAGAFGYFEVTDPFASTVCRAEVFARVGQRTPVAVRFSTVGGESGSADTARDPRGFAVKFYTGEGNWDLVGNNTPIFFIRDPILFPSFIHTQKRNPATHLGDPDAFWDFISLRPETTHQVSFLFSDRGTPDGYRHMNGYSSHAFKNVDHKGKACYVKYHFKTDQGIANLSAQDAARLASEDPDYAIRDLYNAIAIGNFPSWTLYIQVMTYEQAQTFPTNPFDVTKIWPHKDYPLNRVGRLVLNRNPVDYFAEVEQLAFAPSHLVPGIEPSPDKMLQGRLFSYSDTHRHRLGANYQALPVNAPRVPTKNYQRDGPMQVTLNGAGAPNYFPNSFSGPQPHPNGQWHSDFITGDVVREETAGEDDNFTQVRDFYCRTLDATARERLTDNIASHLSRAQPAIRERAIQNFANVHPEYGQAIARKIKRIKASPSPQASTRKVEPLNPARVVPPVQPPSATTSQCPFGYTSKL